MAKGGTYSPFYVDCDLVIDWGNDGEVLKREISEYRGSRGWGYHWSGELSGYSFYFRPGLTFGARIRKFSPQALPAGGIFSHTSCAIFVEDDYLYLALLNASLFRFFLSLQTAVRKMEVGHVQNLPVPLRLSENEIARPLRHLGMAALQTRRELDRSNEISHAFHLPALLQTEGLTLAERFAHWQERILTCERQLTDYQREIDDIAFRLYGIAGEDRQAIEELLSNGDGAMVASEGGGAAETEDADEAFTVLDGGTLVIDLLSYTFGCVFGRWDARIAIDPSLTSKLADPFAPLPVCSPGILVGQDGLPAKRNGIAREEWMRARPDAITPPPEGSVKSPAISDSGYPLAVDWDGILVDDPGHPDDVVRRVRDLLKLLWGERADAVEGEAYDLLGVRDLRTYFRNPRQFFDHHIKRYSKSRRKAPIYWLLQSPKRHYGLWLYYHRLDPDILFKALHKYVEPKIRLEEGRLEEHEARRRSAGTGGREAKQAEKTLAKQEDLLSDLREFYDRLDRAAKLHLRPDLNDGVVLNIAPLHELVPWKEAKSKWNELLAGKYEWSSIGKQLREKGLV